MDTISILVHERNWHDNWTHVSALDFWGNAGAENMLKNWEGCLTNFDPTEVTCPESDVKRTFSTKLDSNSSFDSRFLVSRIILYPTPTGWGDNDKIPEKFSPSFFNTYFSSSSNWILLEIGFLPHKTSSSEFSAKPCWALHSKTSKRIFVKKDLKIQYLWRFQGS